MPRLFVILGGGVNWYILIKTESVAIIYNILMKKISPFTREKLYAMQTKIGSLLYLGYTKLSIKLKSIVLRFD